MDRRHFLGGAACLTAGASLAGLALTAGSEGVAHAGQPEQLYLIGPRAGYTPHIGTLLSMMTMMRSWVIESVTGMTITDLDYLFDKDANTIGALLLHLAATEVNFQLNTFDGRPWGDYPDAAMKKKWGPASELNDTGRASIKGKELPFYLDALNEARVRTLAEFKRRDDKWLFEVDKTWDWGPTNNFCKWFHVCEHESNHRGQIKFLQKRLPGAKPSGH
jgi:hypothetical protein